jgi:hypothetical protein
MAVPNQALSNSPNPDYKSPNLKGDQNESTLKILPFSPGRVVFRNWMKSNLLLSPNNHCLIDQHLIHNQKPCNSNSLLGTRTNDSFSNHYSPNNKTIVDTSNMLGKRSNSQAILSDTPHTPDRSLDRIEPDRPAKKQKPRRSWKRLMMNGKSLKDVLQI